MERFEKLGQRSLPNTPGNTGSLLSVARVNFWAQSGGLGKYDGTD